jgi:hypothetical protein
VLTFQSLLGVRLRDQQPSAAAAAGGGAGADDSTPVMSGRLVMLPTDAEGVNFAAHSDFKLQLLRDMGEWAFETWYARSGQACILVVFLGQ